MLAPTVQAAELGHLKLLQEDYPAAAAHFEAAERAEPLCLSAALGLAEAAVGLGRLEEAEAQLQARTGGHCSLAAC